MEISKKIKGVYVVSESGCLREGSGAHKHITAGLHELAKYFDIKLVLFCDAPRQVQKSARSDIQNNSKIKSQFEFIRKHIRGPLNLLKNHIKIFRYYRMIKKEKPDFIYERSGNLNFNGIIIARLLKIKHFYEVNGIAAIDFKKYHPEYWNRFALWLECLFYKRSRMGFYIGGINKILSITGPGVKIVQNGIDSEFLQRFNNRENLPKDILEVGFIGHAMDHHRLDILFDSFRFINNLNKFRLHLIGGNMQSVRRQLPENLEVIEYGVLSHDQIADVITTLHVGVVPFALDYYSNVKIFQYGAAKLAVILPEVENFKRLFSNDEVVYIKNNNSKDLAEKLVWLSENKTKINDLGNNIYQKILAEFTWEKIFAAKAKLISEILS